MRQIARDVPIGPRAAHCRQANAVVHECRSSGACSVEDDATRTGGAEHGRANNKTKGADHSRKKRKREARPGKGAAVLGFIRAS
eukprot:scaffold118139_cov30-Tisochrysis_lutea.AAC.1